MQGNRAIEKEKYIEPGVTMSEPGLRYTVKPGTQQFGLRGFLQS